MGPCAINGSIARRAITAALTAGFLLGCPPSATVDAGHDAEPASDIVTAGDNGTPDVAAGTLSADIDAPRFANQREETCLTVSHTGGGDAQVRWFVEPDSTMQMGGDRVCHTWAYPGEFRVFVFVDARGMHAERSVSVRVVARPSALRPTASSTIAFEPLRNEVWVVNPEADTITVLAAEPPSRLAEIPVCDHPRTLAISGTTLGVACQDDGNVWLIDTVTRMRRAAIALGGGARPFGIAADPRGGRFLVTLQDSGRMNVIDIETATAIGSVDVGPDPRGIAVNARGIAMIPRWRSNGDGARVMTVDASNPRAPVAGPTGLLLVQEDLDSDTDNSGVPNFLAALAFAPDGEHALIPALKANIVSGTFRTRQPLSSQTTARGILSEVWLTAAPMPPLEETRYSFDDLDYASAVVFSPYGERVYAAIQGAEIVVAIDPVGYNVTGSIADVGIAPQGLALSPDGRLLYVQGFLSRSVRVYDVRDLSRPPPVTADVQTVATEPLAPDVLRGERIFYASRDSRMSLTSYLSCASCHLDGEGDNLVWDFTQRGEGLRNTVSLTGRGGTDHGPLHWSGNFDEIQDFEHDIRNGQGGSGFIADAVLNVGLRNRPLGDPKAMLSPELDALAAYVSSLRRWGTSPFRRDGDSTWTQTVARGEAIFRRADTQCATCHAGSRFTDSAFGPGRVPLLHDVGTLGPGSGGRLGGTLGGIDTPTVRGLWRTAPYLHDGSAATLRDVLVTRNPADRHGRTSTLSPSELADLELYLLSLDDRVP